MLDNFRSKLRRIIGSSDPDILRTADLEEKVITTLVENDVDIDSAEEVAESLASRLREHSKKIDLDTFYSTLRDSIREILEPYDDYINLLDVEKKPFIILFLGVNGGGKTTTVAKLANYLKTHGKRVIISASDTFRAGAIEQIQTLGDRIGIEVMRQPQGADPAAVAFDAVNRATARGIDFVLVDSAGRMQTNRNLLEEMKKIKRVAKPDLSVLVLDSLTGQDAIFQAETFSREISYDSVILTKLDTDAKGGSVITIAHQLKKPILYVGIGQEMSDIVPFSAKWYSEKLLGPSKVDHEA